MGRWKITVLSLLQASEDLQDEGHSPILKCSGLWNPIKRCP